MNKLSILSKKDFEILDKKVFNDNGVTLKSYVYNPSNTVLVFNKGIVIFSIYDTDNSEGYNNDRVCMLYLLYKAKDSEIDWSIAYEEFLNFLRVNKCSKLLMYTKIKPEFWSDKYKFKLKRYEMELDL
tara:strand:- start:18898 stop:19281 length:384 start_codon:yes stop_codon:yes gene_type:complete